jgi:hypothetical protein
MDEIRIPASVNANSGNGGKIGMARRTRLVDGMSVKPRTHPISRYAAYPVTTEADMALRNSEVRKFDRKK